MVISFRKNTLSETSWIYIALLIALSFAIYWRTLSFGFVLDDYFQDRHYSLKEIITTFYSSQDPRGITANFYRPLAVMSHALSYFIFKTNPFGYHLINILHYTINVILVYFIMRKITRKLPPAITLGDFRSGMGKCFILSCTRTNSIFSFVAAILFLLIPYNSVHASGITYRADTIMTLFYLSSFLAFISFYNNQGQKRLFYYLSILGFIFSLMSKEMAVTLPFILLSYSYLESKRLEMKLITPYLVILCAYMLFRFFIFKGIGGYGTIFPLYGTIPLHWCLAFLRTFLLFSYTDFACLPIYLALIFILFFLSIHHFKSFENKNKIFFAFSWIGITILPLYTISSFRLLYLPSIGFAMLLSLICSELYKKNFKYPVIFIIGLCVMMLPINMKYQDAFSPASGIVLHCDKTMYVDYHNKLDKEQLTILEQKLEKYGLLNEAKDLLKRGEKVYNPEAEKTSIAAYIKKLYKHGGLDLILRKHFCAISPSDN